MQIDPIKFIKSDFSCCQRIFFLPSFKLDNERDLMYKMIFLSINTTAEIRQSINNNRGMELGCCNIICQDNIIFNFLT